MKSLINNRYLQKILKMSVKELYIYLNKKLSPLYGAENVASDWDNYMVFRGTTPVGLCAHLDTVLLKAPEEILYDSRLEVMMSTSGGLGADDRAGVVAMLEIVAQGHRPTLIFTNYEEIGGIGASVLSKQDFFQSMDLKYLIEIDRRGSDDCVFYSDTNEEFQDYVEKFGFYTTVGAFSDISILCPALGISGANLSAGYYNEHTSLEILRLSELRSTVFKISEMLEEAHSIEKPFKYEGAAYGGYSYDMYGYGGYGGYDYNKLLEDDDFLKEVFGYGHDDGVFDQDLDLIKKEASKKKGRE